MNLSNGRMFFRGVFFSPITTRVEGKKADVATLVSGQAHLEKRKDDEVP